MGVNKTGNNGFTGTLNVKMGVCGKTCLPVNDLDVANRIDVLLNGHYLAVANQYVMVLKYVNCRHVFP